MSNYLSCAETAKLVRQALKEAFPGVKFSVRSSVYSGGASIQVGWTDGPNSNQVEAVAKVFEGAYFDGMIDYKGSTKALYKGEIVRFGADFIFCNRNTSDRLIENAITALWAENWVDLADVPRPSAEDFRMGRCMGVAWSRGNYDLSSRIHQKLSKRSDRFAQPSPLAQSITYLGNDGYSQVGALDNVDAGAHA